MPGVLGSSTVRHPFIDGHSLRHVVLPSSSAPTGTARPSLLARHSYTDQLQAKGNPCFACGAGNRREARECHACHLPLPIAAPLRIEDAQLITRLGYARRRVLLRRQYVSLGLVLTGFVAFAVIRVVAPPPGIFGAGLLISLVLFVVGIGLFVWNYRRTNRMLGAQVALYGRISTERLLRLHSSSGISAGAGRPLEAGPGFGPLVPIPLGGGAPQPVSPSGMDWLLSASPPSPFHLRKSLHLTGDAGWRWEITDASGRPFARMVIDPPLNRIFQLIASDPSLVQEYWTVRGADESLFGWYVSENRTDDRAGIGYTRKGFYATDGRLVLRVDGSFPTFPRTAPQLVQSFESLTVFDSDTATDPVFRVAQGVREGYFQLVDAAGKLASEARAARATDAGQWLVQVPPGHPSGLVVLATLAVAQWQPDGSTFAIARALETKPELAAAVDGELRR
jgi:hypothetical protein